MQKLISKILIAALLIIAINLNAFSQTQPSITVSRDDTISYLIDQNKASNELIDKQKLRIADLENELAAEKENSNSLGKSYGDAVREIDSLKRSNAALERAVSLNESTIALLKEDNEKQREKTKKANKDKWKAYAIAGIAVALKILIP